MAKILILHGPNLNMLGTREPQLYGSKTLADVNNELRALAAQLGHEISTEQSNAEYKLIEAVQNARDQYQFIIINPGALTHTSIALRDAFAAVNIPFIEVHVSNIYGREPFRHHSYLIDLALGTIAGLGTAGYGYALQSAAHYLETK